MAKRNSKPADESAPESIPTDGGVPLLAGDVLAPTDSAIALAPGPQAPIVATQPEPEPAVDPVRIVKVDLPLLDKSSRQQRYAPRTLRELDRRHAKALRALTDGLTHEGAKVDGKTVRDPDQAIAWLLDQLL